MYTPASRMASTILSVCRFARHREEILRARNEKGRKTRKKKEKYPWTVLLVIGNRTRGRVSRRFSPRSAEKSCPVEKGKAAGAVAVSRSFSRLAESPLAGCLSAKNKPENFPAAKKSSGIDRGERGGQLSGGI